MEYPEDNEVDPEEQENPSQPSREEVRKALAARGYTEIDFEVIEARANKLLEERHIRRILSQFKLDLGPDTH